MKPLPPAHKSRRLRAAFILASAVVGLSAATMWKRQAARDLTPPSLPTVALSPEASAAASPVSPAKSPASPIAVAAQPDPARPLPVGREGAHYQWTAGDGRSDEVLNKIAHNFDEYRRMAEENDRIKDRQLVYCKVTAAELVDRGRAQGAAVQQMALPGMNGQEYQFEITQSDLAPSGQKGTFTGHLAGKDQSVVTLAYKFGRQAFSVMSPEDNLYLEGEAYEPGTMVVKSIDPAAYVPALCGNDDLAQQSKAPVK